MSAKWLNDAVFYEVYPQSFYDSNGDGIGDLNGIVEKLDYIKDLGCNALWINPCFDSPFKDAGYDIRDYQKVAPRYGTNKDLIRLFKNEVYARHGYRFETKDIYNIFLHFTWYYPDFSADNFKESVFNQYEKENLKLLVKLE